MQSADEYPHPAREALTRAVYAALDRCYSLIADFSKMERDPQKEPQMRELVKKLTKCAQEINQLVGWLYPAREPMSIEQILQCREQLIASGVAAGTDLMKDALSGLGKKGPGRPRRQVLYVCAFEFMLQSERNSLGKATRKFCTCKGQHSRKCENGFKAGIHTLKDLLRKYAPELVSRYDTLHPNRAWIRH